MNDSKQILSIENNNDNYKWNDSKGNMVFYNFNSNQNFPISINYRNTDTYKKNNIPEVKIVNENDLEEYKNKQNFTINEFNELLKKKRNLYTSFQKKKKKNKNEDNKNEPNVSESINSNLSSAYFPITNESTNELNDPNETIENLIYQFKISNDEQNTDGLMKKLISLKKKLHKEKLEKFYIYISNYLKEKIEDVREWISLEEKLIKIENINHCICKDLQKYIKIYQSGKFQLENISSKDFLRVHFIGSLRVKINDFKSTLKSYK